MTRIALTLSAALWLAVFAAAALPAFAQDENGPTVTAKPAVRTTTLVAFTRARHVMDIVSEESGRVASVLADVGQAIGDSGVFARLDTTFVDLDIRANEVAQKRLANRMSYWENEVGRFDELVRRNTAAQSSLDELTQQYDQAAFELQSLRVQLQVLRERRDRHTIRVPAGWLVTRRMVEPGEWITTGQHLGQAGDYSTLLVPFALSTREFDRLKDASAITLHLPGAGEDGMRVPARIERVSPLFDPETRKRNVDLAVTPGGFAARGGIRAELTLELPDESGAVMLPASAVTRRYEDIWLTRPDGERVRVVLLGEEEDMARVQSPDVSPGDVFLAEPGE